MNKSIKILIAVVLINIFVQNVFLIGIIKGENNDNPLWSAHAEYYIEDIATSSDGKIIVIGTDEEGYEVWWNYSVTNDTSLTEFYKTRKGSIWTIKGHVWLMPDDQPMRSDSGAGFVDISSDGKYFVAANQRFMKEGYTNIYFHEVDSLNSTSKSLWGYELDCHPRGVALSSDGDSLVAGTSCGIIYYFKTNSSSPKWTRYGDNYIIDVDISSDGKHVIALESGSYSGEDGGKLYVFKEDNSTPIWKYNMGQMGKDDVTKSSIKISSNGKYIVAGTSSSIFFFSFDNPNPLWIYNKEGSLCDVDMSNDGEYIVVLDGEKNEKKALLFRKDSNSPVFNYTLKRDIEKSYRSYDKRIIGAISISENGNYFCAADEEFIYLFRKGETEPIWKYKADETSLDKRYVPVRKVSALKSISMSYDGNLIFICSGSKLRLFNTNPIVPNKVAESPTPSGFEAVFVIAGLLTVAFVVLKRRRA